LKVLILCNDFPPLNSIGAQRPWYWFLYFKELGIEPVVLTKNWKGLSSTPEEIVRNAGDNAEVVEQNNYGTIIRAPIILNPSEKMLRKHGLNSHVMRRRILTFIYKTLSFISFSFDNHRTIYKAAENYLSHNKVDLIIATGEPFILFRYAHLLGRKFQIPWIADYRDGWFLNYVIRQQSNFFGKWLRLYEKAIEKRLIKTAACITSTDPILSSALGHMHKKPFYVVYNGFEKFYETQAQPSSGLPLVLTHSGTLTIGQRAEVLLQAVKELLQENKIKAEDVRIQLIGIEYFPEQLKRFTQYKGVPATCIYTTPRLSRNEVIRINQASDFLLIFTDKKFKWISAKAYDYLACRRPILVMPDDYSIMSSLVNSLQAGVVLNEVEEVKQFLFEAIEKKKKGEPIISFKLNEKDALFYTRKEQTKKMVEVIHSIVQQKT
jgi:hypothetical protein